MSWTNLLPIDLRMRAFRHGEEIGWTKDDALAVISLIETHGLSIEWVDSWIVGATGITDLGNDWVAAAADEKPTYPKTASDFVDTFPWQPWAPNYAGKRIHFMIRVKT